jgi:hypothetical protein
MRRSATSKGYVKEWLVTIACEAVDAGNYGVSMSSYSLPWTVGPLPIGATLWSIYIYGRTILLRTGMNNDNHFSASIIAIGISSFVAFYNFDGDNLFELIVVSQFGASILSILLILISVLFAPKNSDSFFQIIFKVQSINLIKGVSYVITVSTLFDAVMYLYEKDLLQDCGIGKCFMIEDAIGKKTDAFSLLYMVCIVPSYLYSLAIPAAYELIRRSLVGRSDA